jgi:hypothetical protein
LSSAAGAVVWVVLVAVLARLPRARPEPRLVPKAGWVGAAGALSVSAGATGVVSPDGVVSDMLVCVVLLGVRRRGAREREVVVCGSRSAKIGALYDCELCNIAQEQGVRNCKTWAVFW